MAAERSITDATLQHLDTLRSSGLALLDGGFVSTPDALFQSDPLTENIHFEWTGNTLGGCTRSEDLPFPTLVGIFDRIRKRIKGNHQDPLGLLRGRR
jgi:hypothetical protein